MKDLIVSLEKAFLLRKIVTTIGKREDCERRRCDLRLHNSQNTRYRDIVMESLSCNQLKLEIQELRLNPHKIRFPQYSFLSVV